MSFGDFRLPSKRNRDTEIQREREREKERDRGRERESERGRETKACRQCSGVQDFRLPALSPCHRLLNASRPLELKLRG